MLKIDEKAEQLNWSESAIAEEKMSVAIKNMHGLEMDSFLTKVAKAYMAIIGDGKGSILCEDSLENPKNWKSITQNKIGLEKFDVLLTNPPFGKDIKITGSTKLQQYDLAHKWKWDSDNTTFIKTNVLNQSKKPEVLFIERSLQLLKDGGRLGIVLSETFFHAPNSKQILEYMLKNNNVTHIIDLPHNTFRPHNNAKCLAIILVKNTTQQKNINMAVAEEVGHNHNGEPMFRFDYELQQIDPNNLWDDIPLIINEYNENKENTYTFSKEAKECIEQEVLVPRYYWISKNKEIENKAKKDNLQLIEINELIDEGVLSFFNGHGSPPAEYKGKGDYPYIRVKDIVSWEYIKTIHHLFRLIYTNQLKEETKNLKKMIFFM